MAGEAGAIEAGEAGVRGRTHSHLQNLWAHGSIDAQACKKVRHRLHCRGVRACPALAAE